jgi:hypothetical protein
MDRRAVLGGACAAFLLGGPARRHEAATFASRVSAAGRTRSAVRAGSMWRPTARSAWPRETRTATYALSVAADGTVYAVDLGGRGIIRRIASDGTASVVTAGY